MCELHFCSMMCCPQCPWPAPSGQQRFIRRWLWQMGSFCGNLVTYGRHAQCWGLPVTLWLHLSKSPSCPSLQFVLPGPVPAVFLQHVSHTPSEITCHTQAFAVSHLLFASPRFLLSSSQHTHALLKNLWWLLITNGIPTRLHGDDERVGEVFVPQTAKRHLLDSLTKSSPNSTVRF